MLYGYRVSYIIADDPSSYQTPNIEPVHIWNSSKEDIVTIRKKLLRQWFFASIELWILIFLITSIYLGSGSNPSQYTNNLDINIIDFDGDLAGYYFINAFRQTLSGNLTLHWRYKDSSDFNHNIDETQNEVEHGKVWAAVVLRTSTTRLINETLSALTDTTTTITLTSPFIITLPILVIYGDGRNSFTINNYVLPPIRSAIAVASNRYGHLQLLNTFRLGSLLVDPLGAKYQNLHPASPFVGQLATTLGYIYLYLISGMIVGGTIKFLSQFGKIHWFDLLFYRILNGFFQAFIISLIYSLIVLWFFGMNSGSLFMRYWMFNWLSIMVFGIIIVLFTINLGLLGNSLLTIFVILMLASATFQLSLELSHKFYRYGYGLPLYHIINGARHLLFNSYSHFALDIGILLIYLAVLWIVAIVTSIYWMKKQEKTIVQEKEQK
ncbi:hypothetical protein I4U23_028859 [Adineta vaga]|nr:hypothetical protein I4U23_028859 [Adineta vaga]